ncbi:MAG: sigma-70 family RNA polymerase sigma factor [Bacteroidales bacterium]|nr:sigma-70 family RNA polymerase sigma factor [Bacteroidales bacterium]
MQEFSAENILSGIKERDTKVLNFIYDSYFQQIRAFVLNNHGTLEDAQDTYQDAVLVIYQKIVNEGLELTCSFSTYLYSVCRLIWLKQLGKRRLNNLYTEDLESFVILGDDIFQEYEAVERYKLYQDHFNKLSYSCQKVLELFLAKIPLKEIARILGFKNEQYAKKRKFQCKEKLVESIKTDPRFNEIKRPLPINNY